MGLILEQTSRRRTSRYCISLSSFYEWSGYLSSELISFSFSIDLKPENCFTKTEHLSRNSVSKCTRWSRSDGRIRTQPEKRKFIQASKVGTQFRASSTKTMGLVRVCLSLHSTSMCRFFCPNALSNLSRFEYYSYSYYLLWNVSNFIQTKRADLEKMRVGPRTGFFRSTISLK